MAKQITCECGTVIRGESDEEVVAGAESHMVRVTVIRCPNLRLSSPPNPCYVRARRGRCGAARRRAGRSGAARRVKEWTVRCGAARRRPGWRGAARRVKE